MNLPAMTTPDSEAISRDKAATEQIATEYALRLKRAAVADRTLYLAALRAAEASGMSEEQAIKFAAGHIAARGAMR